MTKSSPHQKLQPIGVGEVKWKDGFWGDWFQLSEKSILPSMQASLNDRENGACFGNFYVAAGLQEGKHSGTAWGDGDCYKWMQAVAHVYDVTRNEKYLKMLDELIVVIGKAQDPDGYISTQVQLTEKERWQDFRNHELYNMGHLLTAASVHYCVTGQKSFLTIAIRLGDYLAKYLRLALLSLHTFALIHRT